VTKSHEVALPDRVGRWLSKQKTRLAIAATIASLCHHRSQTGDSERNPEERLTAATGHVTGVASLRRHAVHLCTIRHRT